MIIVVGLMLASAPLSITYLIDIYHFYDLCFTGKIWVAFLVTSLGHAVDEISGPVGGRDVPQVISLTRPVV